MCSSGWSSEILIEWFYGSLLEFIYRKFCVSVRISHNGQGFLLCWYSVIRQPELSLNKVTEVENKFCSSSVLRKAGTKAEFCYVDQDLFVKPAWQKTPCCLPFLVGRWCYCPNVNIFSRIVYCPKMCTPPFFPCVKTIGTIDTPFVDFNFFKVWK